MQDILVFFHKGFCTVYFGVEKKNAVTLPHSTQRSVFFSQAFPILVIACVDLTLVIVDAPKFASTFTWSAAATFISPTVAFTGLNSGNLLGKFVLWHLGYGGCEVIIRLRIFNAVKVSPDFKICYCVLELRLLDPPE